MVTQTASETQETTRSVICGQVCCPAAQGGKLLRGGKDLVALKMVMVVEIMARTIKEQLKLTPRRKNLATRTLFLTFYPSF